MLPIVRTKTAQPKVKSKGHALGGSEIDKIPTKEKMKKKNGVILKS